MYILMNEELYRTLHIAHRMQ